MMAMASDEPRIAPLGDAELTDEGRELAARLRANFGLQTTELPDSIATMLRHPELYRAHVEFVTARAKAMKLSPRDLELFILRTGWLCRSGYIWGEHVKFGKAAGLTGEEVERITQGSAAPGWNDRDRALNKLAEELHETCFVSDETWAVIARNRSSRSCWRRSRPASAS